MSVCMYVSAGHLHCDTRIDPADEVAPEGQFLQDVPSLFMYVLAAQELLQSYRSFAPAEEVVPLGHDGQE